MVEIETEQEFIAQLGEFPEMLDDPFLTRVSTMESAPGGMAFSRYVRLLRSARSDPARAWRDHATKLERDNSLGAQVGTAVEEIEKAQTATDHLKVIELADEALPAAFEAELSFMVAFLEDARAKAYLFRPDGNRMLNVEEAVYGLGRSLMMTFIPDDAAQRHLFLGIALAERTTGDPSENIEQAVRMFREGLNILSVGSPPELRADLHSNLATSLLRTERGDREALLREGLEHCDAAQSFYSIDSYPDMWSVVELNRAPIIYQLSRQGNADSEQARKSFEAIIEISDQIKDPTAANARYQYARLLVDEAEMPIDEEAVELLTTAEGRIEWDAREAKALSYKQEALQHLLVSVSLYTPESDPIPTGRAFSLLSDVLDDLGMRDDAIEAAGYALDLLPPGAAPHASAHAAGSLALMLADEKDWASSAEVYRVAIEASELAFFSRLESSSRERESKSWLNLTRWAAFAFAAANLGEEAVEVLEGGRARELRQRLREPGSLGLFEGDLAPELIEQYMSAIKDYAASPLTGVDDGPHQRLLRLQREIRKFDGFENFAIRSRVSDLSGALEPGWPVLYLNPTPFGTLLLLVDYDTAGPKVRGRCLDSPTSLQVFMKLMSAGFGEELDISDEDLGSYLAGASGFASIDRDVEKDVESVLPWFGEEISRPINDLLVEADAKGVTLVCCGPVGLAPVHAASWSEGSTSRCLLDSFAIRQSPSAAFATATLERARTMGELEPSLVALVNPTEDLDAAEPEYDSIRPLFEGRDLAAYGQDATWDFLRTNVGRGSHMHLACHARSAEWGESPPAIILPDGDLEMTQLTELDGSRVRLFTLSACQSAVADISHMPEEGYSLATVLLATGAACVVASLWPVEDDTTAILMTKFYELMIGENQRPPEALRMAQVWLRDIGWQDRSDFLAGHPALAKEIRRRARNEEAPPHQVQLRSDSSSSERPFASPAFWAPFIAVGS
ncbi:MAG: CHAT domain-containing protein [Solirubrobacterales bacterium]|nr:CHAT domain-containing protein [Solirubrobacterales bacterium]